MAHVLLRKLLLITTCCLATYSYAQCEVENKQFQAGENIQFDLYFKYGILYTKAGTGALKTTNVQVGGKNAYKMSLRFKSSGIVDNLYSMDDTLTSHVTHKLVPLSFAKNALEKGDYTLEKVKYNYLPNGKTSIRTSREKNGKLRFDTTFVTNDECIYDMVSVVYYARTIDFSKMNKGDVVTVNFMSGRNKVKMKIEHHGMETIKANNKKKYECIKLVLNLVNAEKEDISKEEAMKVYISNDLNKIPVKLEFKLKVGLTRGILSSSSGLRN